MVRVEATVEVPGVGRVLEEAAKEAAAKEAAAREGVGKKAAAAYNRYRVQAAAVVAARVEEGMVAVVTTAAVVMVEAKVEVARAEGREEAMAVEGWVAEARGQE